MSGGYLWHGEGNQRLIEYFAAEDAKSHDNLSLSIESVPEMPDGHDADGEPIVYPEGQLDIDSEESLYETINPREVGAPGSSMSH